METLPIATSVEAFLRGFSATRSFTKPYQHSAAAGGVWMLADPPDGKPPLRNTEFVAYGAQPDAVLEAIRRKDPPRHSLCVLLDGPESIDETVAAFKRRGYRFAGREPLFTLRLAERRLHRSALVRRIRTAEDADRIAKAARSRQILPAHLVEEDSICRLFGAFDGATPLGWVRSIRTHPDCAWVSNMFVQPAHRRKGLGRALLTAMLDDDERFGVRWSVLLASSAGALLYPHLGYRQQGILLIFTPKRG